MEEDSEHGGCMRKTWLMPGVVKDRKRKADLKGESDCAGEVSPSGVCKLAAGDLRK